MTFAMLRHWAKSRGGGLLFAVKALLRMVGAGIVVMLAMHGYALVLRLPHTLWELFHAFRPGGYGIVDAELWAFGPRDALLRPWYNKIARDFHTQGRFGYVWDDGLGMPLGMRIYNNLVTYKLLFWLGTRGMAAGGYLLMVAVCTLLCAQCFNLWVGLIVGLLLAGSPLVVTSYTHMGKPEVFWWGLSVPFVYLALSGSGLSAGLLWSLLACANLPVSAMLALVMGPGLLANSLATQSLMGLAAGVAPGAVKHVFRGISVWRSGFLRLLATEQARVYRWPWRPILHELLFWFPFALSVAASAYAAQQLVVGALLGIVGGFLYWVNRRGIYLNDALSFHLAFFSIALGYAAAAQSLVALLCLLAMAYYPPRFYGMPLPPTSDLPGASQWRKFMHNAWSDFRAYPALAPLSVPLPPRMAEFFSRMPDGARFILESDGDPRVDSKFRAFRQWTEEFLPQRQIDLVNEIYTRGVEPDLAVGFLNKFNAEQMTAQEMRHCCDCLGVSHVVAHTSATSEALTGIGYHLVAQAELNDMDRFREMFAVPPVTLALLRSPSPVTVIEPAVAWERDGNVLTWTAEAGQSYVVRYRYNAEFQADQNGEALAVEPTNPIEGIPLTFMRVNAVADGPIALTFRPRWI